MEVVVRDVPFRLRKSDIGYDEFVNLILEKMVENIKIEYFDEEIEEKIENSLTTKKIDSLLDKRFWWK